MKRTTLLLTSGLLVTSYGCKTTKASEPSAATAQPGTSSATISAPGTSLEAGRKLTSMFYSGDTASVWSKMGSEMRSALGSEQKLAAFRQQVEEQLGTETKVLDEKVTTKPPYQVYLRTASFSKFPNPINVQWTLDSAENVAGFFVKPAQ